MTRAPRRSLSTHAGAVTEPRRAQRINSAPRRPKERCDPAGRQGDYDSPGRGPSVPSVVELAGLSSLQRELLDFITDAAEPTWIMVEEMPELEGDRGAAEQRFEPVPVRALNWFRRCGSVGGTGSNLN